MRNKKITVALLTTLIAASIITGCTPTTGNKDTTPSNDAPTTLSFRPSQTGMPALDKYEYPFIGIKAAFTENLRNKIKSWDVFLKTSEDYNADGSLAYASMKLYALTEEQKNREVNSIDSVAWENSLAKIGILGVYHKDNLKNLDSITGCTQHKELGKSADGKYTYYLSFADGADESLKQELEKTDIVLTEMQQPDLSLGQTAFSEGRSDTDNVGDFKTTDISGKEYTKELFKNYDLTLVNVFTTWCSPCVDEMPELEKFKQEMAAKGINVAAIVYDSITASGDHEPGAIEKAKLLQKKANLTFPLLIPDRTDMNGRLKGIDSYPESFFVDKSGNIVGEKYMGAHSFEEWKQIAEKELANLKGTN